MKHNLAVNRNELLSVESYGASPVFLQGIAWEEEKSGDVLVNKASDVNAVVSVVGRVSEHGLYVGPDGTFVNRQYGTLSAAKFLMLLAKPNDTVFASDFDKTISNLEKVQKQIAKTPHSENLVVWDGGMKKLRFTRNVFNERVRRCHLLS
jgi:hypothetical protein